jgi:tripartite-type tricarboxylate transporter receptor subunit TctC
VGQRLSELWGQQVLIENRGGAGGAVGATEAARAAPDGYTIFFPSGSVVTANQHIYANLQYNPERDFLPITNVVSGPQVVVVPANSPYKTLKQLLDAARKEPGKLTFGSAGIGSQVHLAAENLVYSAKIDAVHVPYKGEGPGLVGLMGGETTFMVTNLAAGVGHVNSGRLRALAVTSRERAPQLPDVPTVAETLPGFENTGWFGMVVPTGTPPEIVRKIYEDTRKALDSTEMRARFYAQGMSMVLNTPEDFGRAMKQESALWANVVRERKITVK